MPNGLARHAHKAQGKQQMNYGSYNGQGGGSGDSPPRGKSKQNNTNALLMMVVVAVGAAFLLLPHGKAANSDKHAKAPEKSKEDKLMDKLAAVAGKTEPLAKGAAVKTVMQQVQSSTAPGEKEIQKITLDAMKQVYQKVLTPEEFNATFTQERTWQDYKDIFTTAYSAMSTWQRTRRQGNRPV